MTTIINPSDPQPGGEPPPQRRTDVFINGLSGWMGAAGQMTATGAVISAMLYMVYCQNTNFRDMQTSQRMADQRQYEAAHDQREQARDFVQQARTMRDDFKSMLESQQKHDNEQRETIRSEISKNYKTVEDVQSNVQKMQKTLEKTLDVLDKVVQKVQAMEVSR